MQSAKQYRFRKTVSIESKSYRAGKIVDASELSVGNVASMLRQRQIEPFDPEAEGTEVILPGTIAIDGEAPKPKAKPKPSKKAKGKAAPKPETKSEETEPTPEDSEPSSSADPVESAEPGEPSNE